MRKRPKTRTVRPQGVVSPQQRKAAKAAAGAERAAFFAAGGTPQMWVGRAATYDNDTPAARSRKACRGRVTA